jgi:hypothetical protein
MGSSRFAVTRAILPPHPLLPESPVAVATLDSGRTLSLRGELGYRVFPCWSTIELADAWGAHGARMRPVIDLAEQVPEGDELALDPAADRNWAPLTRLPGMTAAQLIEPWGPAGDFRLVHARREPTRALDSEVYAGRTVFTATDRGAHATVVIALDDDDVPRQLDAAVRWRNGRYSPMRTEVLTFDELPRRLKGA